MKRLALATLLLSSPAWAQGTEAPSKPPPSLDLPAPALKKQKKNESKADEISLEEWNRDDWVLVQPERRALVELDGYFRLRGNMFRKLRFRNESTTEFVGSDVSRFPQEEADYTSTDMRLRLDPVINVADGVQLVTTFDILDNATLGASPRVFPIDNRAPTNALADDQAPPEDIDRDLALNDSIKVRRLYARVSALNEQLVLQFGRMPNHWGLGMAFNSGDCLDCDFGQAVDRASLEFKAANHVMVVSYDWLSTGPVVVPFAQGQPIDAIDSDDAVQYSLKLIREDHPDDIREMLKQDDTVLNYGTWFMWRRQNNGFLSLDDPTNNTVSATNTYNTENRDTNILINDTYVRWYWGRLELNLEGIVKWGSFKDSSFTAGESTKTDILQWGGAAEAYFRFDGKGRGTTLALKGGAASGDKREGFGALGYADTQRGSTGTGNDTALNNFNFSPDYHVDLLLFRRIIGTVTDAWYVKPEVMYMFDPKVAGKLSAMYAQTFRKRSTIGQERPLGLEFDAELSYGIEGNPDESAFLTSIAGGLLFPFGGFKNLNLPSEDQGGSFAWTIQARMYIKF